MLQHGSIYAWPGKTKGAVGMIAAVRQISKAEFAEENPAGQTCTAADINITALCLKRYFCSQLESELSR